MNFRVKTFLLSYFTSAFYETYKLSLYVVVNLIKRNCTNTRTVSVHLSIHSVTVLKGRRDYNMICILENTTSMRFHHGKKVIKITHLSCICLAYGHLPVFVKLCPLVQKTLKYNIFIYIWKSSKLYSRPDETRKRKYSSFVLTGLGEINSHVLSTV